MKNIFKNLKNKTPEAKRLTAIRTIGWGMPVAVIPALRFAQDKDKPKSLKKELFIRDFASYSVGTGLYFGALWLGKKLMDSPIAKNLSKSKKIVAPELTATTSFCLWSGIFGPKVSKKLNKITSYPNEKPMSPAKPRTVRPVPIQRAVLAQNLKNSSFMSYSTRHNSGLKI